MLLCSLIVDPTVLLSPGLLYQGRTVVKRNQVKYRQTTQLSLSWPVPLIMTLLCFMQIEL